MTYVPKTVFTTADCGANCPTCPRPGLTSTWGLNDPEWFAKPTCVRKMGHGAEAHLCYKCQKEWT